MKIVVIFLLMLRNAFKIVNTRQIQPENNLFTAKEEGEQSEEETVTHMSSQ